MPRVRVQVIVTRAQILEAIGGGPLVRRILPRFNPITITLLAVDASAELAGALSKAAADIGLGELLTVTVDGIPVAPI